MDLFHKDSQSNTEFHEVFLSLKPILLFAIFFHRDSLRNTEKHKAIYLISLRNFVLYIFRKETQSQHRDTLRF